MRATRAVINVTDRCEVLLHTPETRAKKASHSAENARLIHDTCRRISERGTDKRLPVSRVLLKTEDDVARFSGSLARGVADVHKSYSIH